MNDGIANEVLGLTDSVTALRTAATPERAEEKIAAEMEAFDAKFAGVLAPNAFGAMRAEHEGGVRKAYDEQLQALASSLIQQRTEVGTGLSGVIAALRQVPREKDATVDAVRESSALQRFAGRTRADLLKIYETTTDVANPTLVNLIENDIDAFRLADDADREREASVLMRFRETIAKRQAARIPADIQAAATTVDSLFRPVAVSQLLDHLKRGRGIATARPVASRPRLVK